jgi:hypothetical protein
MENPFKPGDKVVAMRKGVEIAAMVRTTWNHEVQIFTDTGELLWRTMKTIRMVPVGEPEMALGAPSGEQVVPEEEIHPPQEQSPATPPETVEAESAAPAHVTEAPQEDLAEEDGAAPTEEAPETAPEEPAAAAPKSKKRRRGSRGEEGRSNRSRN